MLRRWFLVQGLRETDLDNCVQYLLYQTEHQRSLDETRRISQQLQLRASLLSIEESKRGIEQSNQVGRLTQLAFVFIPLTFVTGVFGMNITQFGGEAPLWKFWVTAGTISGIAFVIGLMTVWSDIWRRCRHSWWWLSGKIFSLVLAYWGLFNDIWNLAITWVCGEHNEHSPSSAVDIDSL